MSYHHGNLRDSLLQAGSEALRELGPEALSLREIAKRAGVSHNAPYRHFQSKDEFIQDLLEKTSREMAEQILAAPLLYPVSIFMQIQFVGRLWAQMAAKNPRKAHLLFSGLSDTSPPSTKLLATQRLIRLNLSSILTAALGVELHPTTNCDQLATLLIGAFRGLAVMYTSRAESELMASEESLFELTDLAAENILRSYAQS
jgi:AcrR family transcriptional regulator